MCRLQSAGAVLIAKLATGEMAFDDVWWGGKVKNPWNINEGSSGSSAGPAAAVVAGAVAFAVRPYLTSASTSSSHNAMQAILKHPLSFHCAAPPPEVCDLWGQMICPT